MSVQSKFATLCWYLQRPALYRELWRRVATLHVVTPITKRAWRAQRDIGLQWCRRRAVAASAAATALGFPANIQSVADIHRDEWAEAERAMQACPTKMGGAAHLDLLYHLTRHLQAERVLETGVASGWSSLAILLAMGGRGVLGSTDMPYPRGGNEPFVGCVVPARLHGNWVLVRKPDRDGLPELLRRLHSLDLVHHDSDKSYRGRMYVYRTCWPVLREGGVLMSDDIEGNTAFRDFAEHVGKSPMVVQKDQDSFVGVLAK